MAMCLREDGGRVSTQAVRDLVLFSRNNLNFILSSVG